VVPVREAGQGRGRVSLLGVRWEGERVTTALAAPERAELDRLEAVVDRAVSASLEAAYAVNAIREKELWRVSGASSFQKYVIGRWGWSKGRVSQLNSAATAARHIEKFTTVNPTSESQVRPLSGLTEAEQVAAWEEAVETAPKGRVTSAHVQRTVKRRALSRGRAVAHRLSDAEAAAQFEIDCRGFLRAAAVLDGARSSGRLAAFLPLIDAASAVSQLRGAISAATLLVSAMGDK
jgi:hypothetical protein